ncbi:MAG: hypothetical protein ACRDZO_14685 [Egibacteraceae bacterium]
MSARGQASGLPLAFTGVRTTGLFPEMHEIWEAALVIRADGREQIHTWQLPVNQARTDLAVLRSSGRRDRPLCEHRLSGLIEFSDAFADLTASAYLISSHVGTVAEFLKRLLHRHGRVEGWDHLIDVGTLAAGRLAVPPPWDLRALASALNVSTDPLPDSALGAALHTKAIYDAVLQVPIATAVQRRDH